MSRRQRAFDLAFATAGLALFAMPVATIGAAVRAEDGGHMTPEQLEQGYTWTYRHLFSAASIWARRPEDPAAVLPYLAMSTLYKRANPVWELLIRTRTTQAVWSPLVERSRPRHVAGRRALAARETAVLPGPAPAYAGV